MLFAGSLASPGGVVDTKLTANTFWDSAALGYPSRSSSVSAESGTASAETSLEFEAVRNPTLPS
jgi:hypothetical protein